MHTYHDPACPHPRPKLGSDRVGVVSGLLSECGGQRGLSWSVTAISLGREPPFELVIALTTPAISLEEPVDFVTHLSLAVLHRLVVISASAASGL